MTWCDGKEWEKVTKEINGNRIDDDMDTFV